MIHYISFKNSILLLGCCLCLFTGWAQRPASLFELDTILYIKNLKAERRVQTSIRYNISETGMTCLYKIKKNLYIENIDFKTHKRKVTKITNKVLNKQYFSSSTSFSISNDSLIFINDTCLIGYHIKTKKIFLQQRTQSIEYSFFHQQAIYYGRYYSFHPDAHIAPACVYSYNIRNGHLDSIILKADYIEYTHYLPCDPISFNPSGFIYPEFGSYKVYIVNKDFNKIDSVTRDMPNWVSPSRELHQIVKKNPYNINTYFPLLDKENFERISRIEHVRYIDSNTFLVRWFRYDTTFKQRMRTIDIWTKNDPGPFTLSSSNQETVYPILMDSLLSEYGFPLRSETSYTQYASGHIVQIKSELQLDPRKFKTYREYLINREQFGKKNEPVISIWIFKKR
jgi:hypothetical protein